MAQLPDLEPDPVRPRFDALPVSCKVEPAPQGRGCKIYLELVVPDVDRFAMNPNIAPVLNLIQQGGAGNRVRVEFLTDREAALEFERMNPDGTMRELLPQEGTW